MENRLLSMLGLAKRAGKLKTGFDAAKAAAREGSACLLLAAQDISEKTYRNLCYEGERAGIPVRRLLEGQEAVSHACGSKAGVLAVTDEGFARAMANGAKAGKQEKEDDTL